MQASAAAASAVKRVKGGEFHHHVTVQRIDYSAEKAARKAREKQAAKESGGDALRQIEERVQRVVEGEQGKLTLEEQATIDGIWAEAQKRPYPMSREEEPSIGGTAV